jgi:hypothetical protein
MTDAELLEAFETQHIPHEEWNHRAHIRVAYIYLHQHGFESGLRKIRDGIKMLNAVHKVPEAVDRGYHETMTHAFAHIIAAMIEAHNGTLGIKDSNSFCDAHPHLLQRTLLRLYYTRERIMTPEAKAGFVEPDLGPLPTLRPRP